VPKEFDVEEAGQRQPRRQIQRRLRGEDAGGSSSAALLAGIEKLLNFVDSIVRVLADFEFTAIDR
jgi:hypothetical protein